MLGLTADDVMLYGGIAGLAAFFWNVLAFLFAGTWPQIIHAPHEDIWSMRLQIVNGSSKPLMITRVITIPRAGSMEISPYNGEGGLTAMMAARVIAGRQTGRFKYHVPPNATGTLQARAKHEAGTMLVIFSMASLLASAVQAAELHDHITSARRRAK